MIKTTTVHYLQPLIVSYQRWYDVEDWCVSPAVLAIAAVAVQVLVTAAAAVQLPVTAAAVVQLPATVAVAEQLLNLDLK